VLVLGMAGPAGVEDNGVQLPSARQQLRHIKSVVEPAGHPLWPVPTAYEGHNWGYLVLKVLTGLDTPSLAPVAPMDSTV
jgi:hypothetical protein